MGACHERIADHCATLARLEAHLLEHGADGQAQQAARNLLRYFDTAGRHHHEDEERDVFPAWIGHGLYGCKSDGQFLDIGTPETYADAGRFVAAH